MTLIAVKLTSSKEYHIPCEGMRCYFYPGLQL